MTPDLIKSAAYRAIRTFVEAWLGVILAVWFGTSSVDGHRVTGLWDTVGNQWDLAAGAALIASLGALGWRTLLDPSPVPSLADPPPDQADVARR